MIESSEAAGMEWISSIQGRNPTDEDALAQVKPIRDVSELGLHNKQYEGY
jgi:hypothetical protein